MTRMSLISVFLQVLPAVAISPPLLLCMLVVTHLAAGP